mgnify:CR=1 FL=1
MSKVVTLPIKPTYNNSFLKLFTPFVADLISKVLKSGLTIMLNTHIPSRRDRITEDIKKYKKVLKKINIRGFSKLSFQTDGSKKYQNFVSKQLECLFEKGLVKFENKIILLCECGKVEILKEAVGDVLVYKKRKSLLIQDKKDGSSKCSLCSSKLKEKEEIVAILKFPDSKYSNLTETNIYPNIFIKEIIGIYKWYLSHGTVISRSHKKTNLTFQIDNKSISLDTDFWWSLYLGYIAQKDQQIYLVTGQASLNHATRVILICSVLFPKIKIELVIHPVIRINDSKSNMSEYTVDEYLTACGNTKIARAFLSLGLHWGHSSIKIPSTDLFFIQKMFEFKKIQSHKNLEEKANMDSLIKKVNRRLILILFKKIRQGKTLTKNERQTMNLILG